MFILVRRPYSIGDRIHVSNVVSSFGVELVQAQSRSRTVVRSKIRRSMAAKGGWWRTLLSMKRRQFGPQPRNAAGRYRQVVWRVVITCRLSHAFSLANGSLASSRIINGARSPQAQFHIFLKFPIATEFDKILIFKVRLGQW